MCKIWLIFSISPCLHTILTTVFPRKKAIGLFLDNLHFVAV